MRIHADNGAHFGNLSSKSINFATFWSIIEQRFNLAWDECRLI